MKALTLLLTGSSLAILGAACTLLEQPAQCASDADCSKFSARCDVDKAICVAPTNTSDVSATTPDGGATESGAAEPGPTTQPPPPPECMVATKPQASATETLALGASGASELTQALTLGCDKDWTLTGTLLVKAGATLTIAAGTTIRARKGTTAAIIVQPGGRIVAEGQRNAPIVLTVDDPAPVPGDWRGLFVLGNAPRNGTAPYDDDPLLAFGGTAIEDDSGVLSFVRVEYSAEALVLGGVGRKTRIDSLFVRRTADNCYAIVGGNADAKHLVCQEPVDDHFELAQGYTGRLQFVYGQRVAAGANHHGLLIDGAGTAPVLYNVTLCGQTPATNGESYAIVVRNGARFEANNAVLTGWFGGIEGLNAVGAPNLLRGSVAFANATNPVHAEVAGGVGPLADDDNGFDELALWADGDNSVADPQLGSCTAAIDPKPFPAASLTAGARTPPAEFFETTASYAGAFKDATDTWLSGTWARFDNK
jgi:hypothetical protein